MVRFGKNGSDATSGAVRLARAYTGRDHIAMCGYHGWQDWSNGVSGRNAGVPQAVKDLTHVFKYNDIDSLYRLFLDRPGQYACVIMEPVNKELPENDFLHKVKELAHANGALFIMDEVITGFRLAIGGAQEYFNIVPDLATFGKAIANGYPLSALAGRADIMQTLERVHFSFTNGGELVSLAAAKATLKKLKDKNVPEHLAHVGKTYLHDIGTGHPAWKHLKITNQPAFMAEMHKHGILCFGTINLNYSHSQEDMFALQNALAHWEDIPCEKTGFSIR
jgi:glutamate-1-semialdehyde 2,1-aminomutase